MRLRHFIDIFKGFTFFFILLMMGIYNQWGNTTAWTYLALHGSYGFLWLMKSRNFPDKQWERHTSIGFGLLGMASLSLYLVAPVMLNARGIQAPAWYLGACVFLCIFGTFFHFAADMQKFMALRCNENQLFTQGLWRYSRNPNYFGELMIYLGFGLLAMHWLPIVILAIWIFFYWLPNMRKKDRSLSRYPDFKEYQSRTKLFIPFLF